MQREERRAGAWPFGEDGCSEDGRVNRSQQNFRGLRWDWDTEVLSSRRQSEDVMQTGLLLHQTILLDKNCKKGELIRSFALLQLIVGCSDNENNPERKHGTPANCYEMDLLCVKEKICCTQKDTLWLKPVSAFTQPSPMVYEGCSVCNF